MSLRQVATALAYVGATVVSHGWLVLAIASAPAIIVCCTVIVLVVATERSKRVESVKALAPALTALASRFGRQRADPRRSRS